MMNAFDLYSKRKEILLLDKLKILPYLNKLINTVLQNCMEQIFKQLASILTLKQQQLRNYTYHFEGTSQHSLEKFILAYMQKQNYQQQTETYTRFIQFMSEQKHCKLSPAFFTDLSNIKVLVCSGDKSYTFDPDYRAYCLYGRAVSALKRKTKQVQSQRSFLCSQLQSTIFQMFQEGKLFLPKNESHEIEDVLLNFTVSEDNLDPIYLGNQVYSPFIPQPFALILILPFPMPRPDHLTNFLKGTLFHVYMEQANLMSKLALRQVFYKNSTIKGIYFIEEGEVQSTGGRIVARGWVTNGKFKSQGYGWKFKALHFLKSIAKNEQIWKQFINDLNLNKQYPFKLSYILGLDSDVYNYQLPDRRGRRGAIKLPRIVNRSFDYGKLTQIEKVKHYDDRISDICDYKQKLLNKKSLHLRNSTGISESYDDHEKRMIILRNQSQSRAMLKYPSNSLASSHQNILIMSVLKKLQSLSESVNYAQEEMKDRRAKIKISPAKLFEKSRVMKKKRYNQ